MCINCEIVLWLFIQFNLEVCDQVWSSIQCCIAPLMLLVGIGFQVWVYRYFVIPTIMYTIVRFRYQVLPSLIPQSFLFSLQVCFHFFILSGIVLGLQNFGVASVLTWRRALTHLNCPISSWNTSWYFVRRLCRPFGAFWLFDLGVIPRILATSGQLRIS